MRAKRVGWLRALTFGSDLISISRGGPFSDSIILLLDSGIHILWAPALITSTVYRCTDYYNHRAILISELPSQWSHTSGSGVVRRLKIG